MRRWLLLLALAAACGGEDHIKAGEWCSGTSTYYCPRAATCGVFPNNAGEVQACEGAFVQACCGGPPNRCGEESMRTQDDLDSCTQAISVYSCTAIAQGTVPSVCLTGQ